MGGDHGPQIAPIFFKKDACYDITGALPKLTEMGTHLGSYGGEPGTRPKTGTFVLARANGGATVWGSKYYNFFNLARLSHLGKWFAFLSSPAIAIRLFQKQRSVCTEYDLNLENYAPFEAKKNPAHGH
eukprot:NODE_3340_length_567_cov_187.687259_g2815_i0.p2 GENE.NODE_3340_length_567_cov_187.687259_g2815_i0~~NODE_3340_length_567_cov_187.687259_g2815_i0.p2  ORF type:complete len:128 (+),score=35.26 NODE_3340_length_567_cov_187.687259_g2815_i0:78-461(+)